MASVLESRSMTKHTTDLSDLFRALADRTRLRLLNLIGDGELCVCFFVEILGTHQPKISRHLAYLRRVGIVSARREGKWMHYRLAEPVDPAAHRIFDEVRDWLRADPQMQRERKQLEKICCGLRTPKRLKSAPLPVTSLLQLVTETTTATGD
jgi:ArsR family transcriptional regulator, arsenate/arsenite/antimonite-responsive transcriptional repressor